MNCRMEQLDSTRQQKPTQQWMGRHLATYPYERILPWILLRLGVAMPADPMARRKLFAHKILPDLPEYVDPLKDGEAAIQNMDGNISTLQEECSKRGRDWRKVLAQKSTEQKEIKRLGLEPVAVSPFGGAKKLEPEPTDVSNTDD